MTPLSTLTQQPSTMAQAYQQASDRLSGACPIEAGTIGALADLECVHQNMPTRRRPDDPACGCWRDGRRIR